MSVERAAEIEDLAEFVAGEHWGSGRLDPQALARSCGLTFSFGQYGDCFDGYLECKARRFHIYINLETQRSADAPRARFSFAHELGHYFLDWHRCALERGAPAHGSKTDFASSDAVEREADFFAANLLLPKGRLKKEAARSIDGAEVTRLAGRFGTSLSSTAMRCARLSLAPLIVMRWMEGRRAWCWSSREFEEKTRNRGFRLLDRIPPDSTTRLTLDGGSAPEPKGTTLATWFPSVWAGSSDDVILREECIPLGAYGALTILRPV